MIILYILAAILLALFALRFFFVLKMRRMKGRPAPKLAGRHGKAISTGGKVLFYFHSPNCGACRSMTPMVKSMAELSETVFSIDVSRDYQTASQFGIMATPTTVLVEEGGVKELLLGPQPESRLRSLLEP